MGDILGIGLTHYPPFMAPDEDRLIPLRLTLARDERVPAEMKDPANWPEPMRGGVFTCNVHGHRVNHDRLERVKSGYVAHHEKDFLLANDAWARFINFKYGPDGNVYVIDWYDKQACHRNEPVIWDRTNGRIYKVSYRGTKPVTGIDLQKCSDEELVKYQLHDNEWYVRHARRILQERAATFSRDAQRSAFAPPTRLINPGSCTARPSPRP